MPMSKVEGSWIWLGVDDSIQVWRPVLESAWQEHTSRSVQLAVALRAGALLVYQDKIK